MTQVEPPKSPITIKVANGSHLTSISKGADRTVKVDALIVEELSHNLLSVSKLNSKQNTVIFTRSCATRATNNNFQIECKAHGNLFVASFECVHKNCNLSISSDS
ncbi:hypothetical protein PR048_011653 [Dryococelus australis]|uniref:Uncharacterized protein n=1 Tax=Dryococelus australis TaxID=614101 RepID=A0ABQ9HMY6_9NEOP|nr:hypothetical protein PR048_011653 [Dryococelus australis]